MRLVRDNYLIKVDKTHENTIDVGGVEMYLDSSYNPMHNARQHGTIVGLPGAVHPAAKMDIQIGDIAYFHHFVIEESNRVSYHEEEDVFQAHFSQIYCVVRDGEIIMQSHWNFVEQKEENEEDIKTKSGLYFKSNNGDVELYGYLRHTNDWMLSNGGDLGDEVVFSKNSEYDMEVEGKKYLRMRNIDILATVQDGR